MFEPEKALGDHRLSNKLAISNQLIVSGMESGTDLRAQNRWDPGVSRPAKGSKCGVW